MTVFHDIKLEIVRPGPAHNQLLSPLTLYTALCGESAPVNFSIELEQHQLLNKISNLRYSVWDNGQPYMIAEKSRNAAVNDMGQVVGQILAKLQNLLFEQGRALGQAINEQNGETRKERMVHLRLVSSASELANIPFEMAISPSATPAEGRHLLLDLNLPIILTREIRRTRPIPVPWNRPLKTKVLVIAAQPGLLTVPLNNHIRALRKSLEPWIGWPQANQENGLFSRAEKAMECIRILKDASLKSIHEICSEEHFTHVHILAHGGTIEDSGEQRFGLILCDPDDRTKPHHVSGDKLAKALQAEHRDGTTRSSPTMITLATCDSGAQGSVLTPGGSLAYDLHLAGIPWVIASQFPLSKKGSTVMTRELYPRILRGDDPRKALFEVRRVLFTQVDQMHDWASLVIYASLPENFDSQVTQFFETQTIAKIDTAMDRADHIIEASELQRRQPEEEEIKTLLNKVEGYLGFWKKRLPEGNDMASRLNRAEFYGISGSVNKRSALLHFGQFDGNETNGSKTNKYLKYLKMALNNYDQAIDQWATDAAKYHWVATQYLSLKAVLDWFSKQKNNGPTNHYDSDERDKDFTRYNMAKELANRDIQRAESLIEKAWSCGTLAELELLSLHYNKGRSRKYTAILKDVLKHCDDLIGYVGPDSFAVKSTRRQFLRYKQYWGDAIDKKVGIIAGAAARSLTADN